MNRRIQAVDNLDEYSVDLAQMVAKTSYLPHPDTVAEQNGPVFPTVRYTTQNKRLSLLKENGTTVGMYDDNMTPAWALLWAHDLRGTRPPGWNIAHIWHAGGDRRCYTHLANLVMIPECFESLTNKFAPLTKFLRWHAWSVYRWKPEGEDEPEQPQGYEGICWRYFLRCDDPRGAINRRLSEYNNQRVQILRPLMQSQ